jgi:hypothetical protein
MVEVPAWNGPMPLAHNDTVELLSLPEGFGNVCVGSACAAIVALKHQHVEIENVLVHVPPLLHVRMLEQAGHHFIAGKVI